MASSKNISQSKAGKLTPKVALSSHKTFYVKEWQDSGYYPIYKFVWHEEQNGYEQFNPKEPGWHSWGVAKVADLRKDDLFTNTKNIFSFREMTDSKTFNTK